MRHVKSEQNIVTFVNNFIQRRQNQYSRRGVVGNDRHNVYYISWTLQLVYNWCAVKCVISKMDKCILES